jgi:hypothetical protein
VREEDASFHRAIWPTKGIASYLPGLLEKRTEFVSSCLRPCNTAARRTKDARASGIEDNVTSVFAKLAASRFSHVFHHDLLSLDINFHTADGTLDQRRF